MKDLIQVSSQSRNHDFCVLSAAAQDLICMHAQKYSIAIIGKILNNISCLWKEFYT